MTIDERYGYPTVPEVMMVPVDDFPAVHRERLMTTLHGVEGLWRELEVAAFRRGGVVYLRVTLDVGDQPLHLYLHEDGDLLQFDAPVLLDFPRAASLFVLTELCGSNTYLGFRVDEQVLEAKTDEGAAAQDRRAREALIGWGRFDFDRFLELAGAFLPYVVVKLSETERDLRAFQGGPPPIFTLAA